MPHNTQVHFYMENKIRHYEKLSIPMTAAIQLKDVCSLEKKLWQT